MEGFSLVITLDKILLVSQFVTGKFEYEREHKIEALVMSLNAGIKASQI